MTEFTPVTSALGGVLIGLSSALLWRSYGKVAGISGIVGGLLTAPRRDLGWRAAFVLGLLSSGWVVGVLVPSALSNPLDRSLPTLVIAGLLVGFGTRLGNGCTSGHGVCGISRLSARSLLATLLFTVFGMAAVYGVEHLLGGAS